MKLIVDSCVDLNQTLFPESDDYLRIPFKVIIDGKEYVDEKQTVIQELRDRQYQSKSLQTACPAPGDFFQAMQLADQSFVVTISGKLSGTYQAATSGALLLEEEFGDTKQTHVFDSKTASAGESLVALKINELMADGLAYEDIITETQSYIDSLQTLFVLETMDTLVSSGRVNRMQQLASQALKLYPIMGDDGEGMIERKGMARGEKHMVPKLIEAIGENKPEYASRPLAITHVNNPQRAQQIKDELERTHTFRDIYILEASGLSSVYASDNGIVLAF